MSNENELLVMQQLRLGVVLRNCSIILLVLSLQVAILFAVALSRSGKVIH